jgi:signal transduction histidine kinase/CheY-like chemotaxis protein
MAHILVVDDRPVNRELLVTVLGYYGHTLAEAGSGAEALEQIAQRTPQLVITDLLMPNMDGEELCRRLKADTATAQIPIVIHTASYRARQARQIADRLGVRWILPKPSEPAQIISLVNEALGDERIQRSSPPVEAATDGSASKKIRDEFLDHEHIAHELGGMQERNQRLTQLLEDAIGIAKTQHRSLATGSLGQEMQSLNLRLTNLVNLGIQLSWERNPDTLAETFCEAAQDILSARYIGLVILDGDGGLRKFSSRGLDRLTHDAISADIGNCDASQRVLSDSGPARMIVAAKLGDFTGLPLSHAPVQTMLACPVMARESVCGWMYAADRLGDDGFSVDDERLITALGASFATAWSSLMVVDELDRRVVERTRELKAANTELQAYSSVVSHDLRAPLGNIDGFAHALAHKFGENLPEGARRYLGNIQRNVEVMGRLIDDLLRFARTSQTALHLREVELTSLAQKCIGTFEEEVSRRNIVIQMDPLGSCRADPALLTQVFLNLVGNAVKYTLQQPHAIIEIGSRMVNAERIVFVKDNGAGFDMQMAQRLFTPFFRLHSANEFAGSGIGLALVKTIVERHGGRVWAEATPGEGACFYFTLPAQKEKGLRPSLA